MKITAQEEYGVRCLLRLARVGERQSLTISEIAAAEGLSPPYAAKLLSVLRQSGFIESARGRVGGYRLSALPHEIRLGAVLHALGEPLFDESIFCRQHAGTETDGNCVHHDECALRVLWRTLEFWVRQVLENITLADLLRNEGQMVELVRRRLTQTAVEPPPELVPLMLPSL
jgi:Rrf2 family protein